MGHPQPATPVQTKNSASPLIISSSNAPVPSICASTGYEIRSSKDNLSFIGDWASATWLITTTNITCPHITNSYNLATLHMEPPEVAINYATAYALHALQGCAKPAPWYSMVPRVQGIQCMHTNTPAGQHAIASKVQTVLSHTCSSRCNYVQAIQINSYFACSYVSHPF
jgi:hypothetical protein